MIEHARQCSAVVVVGAFALADADPVLKLFTWLTNLGALGVLLLMTLTSFAVIAFFRKRPELQPTPCRRSTRRRSRGSCCSSS